MPGRSPVPLRSCRSGIRRSPRATKRPQSRCSASWSRAAPAEARWNVGSSNTAGWQAWILLDEFRRRGRCTDRGWVRAGPHPPRSLIRYDHHRPSPDAERAIAHNAGFAQLGPSGCAANISPISDLPHTSVTAQEICHAPEPLYGTVSPHSFMLDIPHGRDTLW